MRFQNSLADHLLTGEDLQELDHRSVSLTDGRDGGLVEEVDRLDGKKARFYVFHTEADE